MSRRIYFFSVFISAIIGGLVALVIYNYLGTRNLTSLDYKSFEEKQNVRLSNIFSDTSFTIPDGLNFVYAAETVTPTVVHIKSSYSGGRGYFHNPLEEFFELRPESPRERRGLGYGSGVIISEDGFIVTNHHVIDNADLLEVTFFDGRKVNAKLMGKDPTTDLALIKVAGENLPYAMFGDSDKLKIGEWVLAIGNPYANGRSYDLTSTVTAGIISAKGRSIGILRDSLRIESFIQTDAAVNPGNSGGALINLKGELIGINTAIASPTGSFSGYSFAIPVSIVKKVMNDLLEYGSVQRALLGVMITEIDSDIARSQKILEFNGVFIEGVTPRGAAEEAGIQPRDVIISIDGKPTNSVPQLQELVAQKRPGDRITVEVLRQGQARTLTAALKSAKRDEQTLSTTNLESTEYDGGHKK
jgi:serine protease Do